VFLNNISALLLVKLCSLCKWTLKNTWLEYAAAVWFPSFVGLDLACRPASATPVLEPIHFAGKLECGLLQFLGHNGLRVHSLYFNGTILTAVSWMCYNQ
jgi:hypothetical protein